MKRLLDDPTDEVTRLLIRAGVDHQPPRDGKLRLVAALGVGGAFSLLSSEVFAWLGTSAGKATLAVAALGAAASGVYSASGEDERSQLLARPPAHVAPAHVAPADVARPVQVAQEGASPLSEETAAQSVEAGAAPRLQRSPTREAARRTAPRVPEPARQHPVGVEGQPDERRLGVETRWVDRLRAAAERNDRETLQRLLDAYAEEFPEGQLRPEVDRIQGALK